MEQQQQAFQQPPLVALENMASNLNKRR